MGDAVADLRPECQELIGKRVGNFVLSSVLGQGGMGEVFLAVHPALGRQVAVKFLSRMLAAMPEMSARFLEEARSAASFSHPNIVDILDFGELEGQPYYVMEHLQGSDLSRLLANGERFSPPSVGEHLSQIGSALDVAHARGIVHRDLKPANVFVRDASPLSIKLLDFGIAKVMDSRAGAALTQSGQVMGTPSHMAPEQAMGAIRDICPQTDLYSLGVILYEMLTGRPPFAHDSPVVVMMMHIRDPFPPVRQIAPEVPEAVARVVEWCLAKSPAKRPQTARELVQSFVGAVRDERAPSRAPVPPPVSPAASPPVLPPAYKPTVVAVRLQAPAPERAPVVAPAAPPAPEPVAVGEPAPAPPPKPKARPPADAARDKAKLDRLLAKMQTTGDFPAFMKNVTEISQNALPTSALSASGLATSILRDYALTAKLLRVVNGAYYERFGKRVNSVSRAVVVLGFEKVRSLALAIALNHNPSKKTAASPELSELSICALISGEIARRLASSVGVADPEEAQVCAMFHNVGEQLLVHYLPAEHKKVREAMDADGIPIDEAAAQVLGISLRALGLGMVQRWRFSERVAASMTPTETTGKPKTDDERLRVLSTFSNELSEIVANRAPEELEAALGALVERYKVAIPIRAAQVPELLGSVQASFNERYASLLNLDPAESRLCQNASLVSGLAVDGKPPSPVGDAPAPKVLTAEERALRIDKRLDQIEAILKAPHQPREVIGKVLEIFGTELGFRRAMVLVPSSDRASLEAQSAWGEDAKALEAEFVVTLGSSAETDLFSTAYHSGREEIVADAFDPKVMTRVPRLYYEMIGSPAFVLYPCGAKGTGMKLLFANTDTPAGLPGPDRDGHVARFREILGRRALTASVLVDTRRRPPRR
jgi:serine/threonine protein kinase/HD-like signal output (HDOD) protein